jgi:hypothetical protein
MFHGDLLLKIMSKSHVYQCLSMFSIKGSSKSPWFHHPPEGRGKTCGWPTFHPLRDPCSPGTKAAQLVKLLISSFLKPFLVGGFNPSEKKY